MALGGDPLDGGISIGQEVIDEPYYVLGAYAQYWFDKAINNSSVIGNNAEADRAWTVWILAEYFPGSFRNDLPAGSANSLNGWVNALWQVRKECGKSFTDRSLFYATTLRQPDNLIPNDPMMKEFNEYFFRRLFRGMFVVANGDDDRFAKVHAILEQRGLLPSK